MAVLSAQELKNIIDTYEFPLIDFEQAWEIVERGIRYYTNPKNVDFTEDGIRLSVSFDMRAYSVSAEVINKVIENLISLGYSIKTPPRDIGMFIIIDMLIPNTITEGASSNKFAGIIEEILEGIKNKR